MRHRNPVFNIRPAFRHSSADIRGRLDGGVRNLPPVGEKRSVDDVSHFAPQVARRVARNDSLPRLRRTRRFRKAQQIHSLRKRLSARNGACKGLRQQSNGVAYALGPQRPVAAAVLLAARRRGGIAAQIPRFTARGGAPHRALRLGDGVYNDEQVQFVFGR